MVASHIADVVIKPSWLFEIIGFARETTIKSERPELPAAPPGFMDYRFGIPARRGVPSDPPRDRNRPVRRCRKRPVPVNMERIFENIVGESTDTVRV